MDISRRWLEAFLNSALDLDTLRDHLAMRGAPVDSVVPLYQDISGVIVAEVEEVRPHPNADRLHLCQVNDGGPERHQVVCGATNVAAGQRYPFAPVGTTLPGDLTIQRRKLRGEVSQGMLCSGRELGLSDDHDGLYTLTTDAAPGTPLLDVLPLRDDRVEIDVTPNRPDLLGHKGVAREVASALGIPFRLPLLPESRIADVPPAKRVEASTASTGGITVSIEPDSGCARFLGAVVRGVQVDASPLWLRQRLLAAGARSINNVVDATNYVMLELGQPLHAYDLGTLAGDRIEARRARDGETVTTLDQMTRLLDPSTIVIADGERVVGIGGIMGGVATEVTDQTSDIFLECAWFDPSQIRASRRVLNCSTDASFRFERGTDLWGAPEALRRALEVILTVAGGSVAAEPVDLWPEPTNPPRIFLRVPRVARVLGIALPLRTIEETLIAIGATIVAKPAEDRIAVDVPGWRPDLVEEIDLIEEIARIYGYDRFPADLRSFRVGSQHDAPDAVAASRVRRGMVTEGLYEAITLPLTDDHDGIGLANPLSADHRFLRASLLPGLARQVERNWAARRGDVRLFEIGTVFLPPAGDGVGARPCEEIRVAVVVTGDRHPPHWSSSFQRTPVDQWDLKGLFERTVALANPTLRVQVQSGMWVATDDEGRIRGEARELDADRPPWASPLYGLELVIDLAPRSTSRFVPWPSMPTAERDLALLLPGSITVAQVTNGLAHGGGAIVEAVTVIDEFRGKGVPDGSRSVAFRLRFQDAQRTLKDKEIDRALERARMEVEKTLGVTLRTS